MIKTKKTLKKLLISLLVILTLFNFMGSISPVNDVFASSDPVTAEPSSSGGGGIFGAIGDFFGGIINGIVGMLLNFVKTIIVSPI